MTNNDKDDSKMKSLKSWLITSWLMIC